MMIDDTMIQAAAAFGGAAFASLASAWRFEKRLRALEVCRQQVAAIEKKVDTLATSVQEIKDTVAWAP